MTVTTTSDTRTLEPDVRDSEKPTRPLGHTIDPNRHRRFIGYIGISLPFVLVLAARLRPTEGLDLFQHSMSAYYYTSSIAFLEGSLAALAVFLLAYQGYPNKYRWADEWAARVAGGSAIVIALFPTYPPEEKYRLPWWTDLFGEIHDGASVVMFVMFVFFCLWLFRKTDPAKQNLTPGKKWRNHLYLACGFTIVGSMAWALIRMKTGKEHIFWQEAIAIAAFSIAFMVKGGRLRRVMPFMRD